MITQKQKAKAILLAGLLAGSLDILSAFIDYYIRSGKGPEGVLRFVASGVFGNAAFTSGSIMIWLGLLFHFIAAFGFTIFFFILYPKVKLLRINILLTALIIGIVVWLVMNRIIVPLSNTPKFPFDIKNAFKAALILICMIGLPLSIIMRSFFRNQIINKSLHHDILDARYN